MKEDNQEIASMERKYVYLTRFFTLQLLYRYMIIVLPVLQCISLVEESSKVWGLSLKGEVKWRG